MDSTNFSDNINTELFSYNSGFSSLDNMRGILIDAFEAKPKMRELDLSANRINARHIEILADVLKNLPSLHKNHLTELYLDHNEICDCGMKALGEILEGSSILSLNLSYNEIYKINGLFPALERNTVLKSLLLTGNYLRDEGAKTLAGAINGDNSLSVLYLDENNITDKGASFLADALMSNTQLKFLELGDNKITDYGAKELGRLLCGNKQLDISFRDNAISSELINSLNMIREVKRTKSNEDLQKVCLEKGFIDQCMLCDLYSEMTSYISVALEDFYQYIYQHDEL